MKSLSQRMEQARTDTQGYWYPRLLSNLPRSAIIWTFCVMHVPSHTCENAHRHACTHNNSTDGYINMKNKQKQIWDNSTHTYSFIIFFTWKCTLLFHFCNTIHLCDLCNQTSNFLDGYFQCLKFQWALPTILDATTWSMILQVISTDDFLRNSLKGIFNQRAGTF